MYLDKLTKRFEKNTFKGRQDMLEHYATFLMEVSNFHKI